MSTRFHDDRIALEPSPVHSGGKLHIKYQGLLRNSGADEVYLHYGFDGWKQPSTVKMNRLPDGVFGAEINVTADREVNFCFKDGAGHWDNNSGWNWRCEVV